jgi:hypothetical protein
MSVESTLKERGARYGDFSDHARLCQALKDVMASFSVVQKMPQGVACVRPWHSLPDTHKQSLEVIADKIARILSGDPNYADNWHDIQGYAKLVEDRLVAPGGVPEARDPLACAGCPAGCFRCMHPEPAAAIDDESPRAQALGQNGNTGEHYRCHECAAEHCACAAH